MGVRSRRTPTQQSDWRKVKYSMYVSIGICISCESPSVIRSDGFFTSTTPVSCAKQWTQMVQVCAQATNCHRRVLTRAAERILSSCPCGTRAPDKTQPIEWRIEKSRAHAHRIIQVPRPGTATQRTLGSFVKNEREICPPVCKYALSYSVSTAGARKQV